MIEEMHKIKDSRIMVTGGAGFIGSQLASRLIQDGAKEVVILDSFQHGEERNLSKFSDKITVIRFTLGNDSPEKLIEHLTGIDYIFHLAAEKHQLDGGDGIKYIRTNVDGMYTLLEAAVKSSIKKIIFSSSLYVYGLRDRTPFSESTQPTPLTMYGITKHCGEEMVRYFGRQYGLSNNILRYFFVYGAGQSQKTGYRSVILKNFRRILADESPIIHGDGEQVLDYVYIDDVVEATIRALVVSVSDEVLNVGSGEAVSVKSLTNKMVSLFSTAKPVQYAPKDWTDKTYRVADITKIKKMLGWSPKVTLEQGLQRTLSWLKEGDR